MPLILCQTKGLTYPQFKCDYCAQYITNIGDGSLFATIASPRWIIAKHRTRWNSTRHLCACRGAHSQITRRTKAL
jgi:hypothetical protein